MKLLGMWRWRLWACRTNSYWKLTLSVHVTATLKWVFSPRPPSLHASLLYCCISLFHAPLPFFLSFSLSVFSIFPFIYLHSLHYLTCLLFMFNTAPSPLHISIILLDTFSNISLPLPWRSCKLKERYHWLLQSLLKTGWPSSLISLDQQMEFTIRPQNHTGTNLNLR